MEDQGNNYTHISTATTTTIGATATSRICLKTITVNTTAAGTVTIKDGSATVAVLKASVAEGAYFYGDHGIVIGSGCTIVTAAASDLTVVWSNL
jgi:hypothetical protein